MSNLTSYPRPARIFVRGWFLLGLVLAGCAGLGLETTEVIFDAPTSRFDIVSLEPNETEKAGVLLRFNFGLNPAQESREDTVLFTKIENGRGTKLEIVQNREETYEQASGENAFRLKAKTSFEKMRGAIEEETRVTDRGEIVEFIRGSHQSQAGRIRVTSWKREPVLPESPVRISDTWTYEEIMGIELESFWIKQKGSTPYRLRAQNKLAGFARVNGRRCAVIETTADQIKTENLKVLFKQITLNIRAHIRQITYFDYENGRVLVRFTTTDSEQTFPELNKTEKAMSQSVYDAISHAQA